MAPASKLEGLNDLSADLFSDDPFKRDRAQQYERVKLQLLQLKARLRASRDGTTEPLPEASADTTGGQQQKVPPSKIEFFPATETTADSTNNSDPDAAPPMESADPDLASS